MKILIIITKGVVGGAQMAVFTMAKELKSRGHSVVVGMGEGDFLKRKLENENIPVHFFTSLRRTKNPFVNLSFIFEIKTYIRRNKFNIVHFNSSNALLGAIGAKVSGADVKTVFTFHGLSTLDSNHGNKVSRIIYWIIFKFFLIFIDKSIFVSYNNLNKAKRMRLVKSGNVVYNGINPTDLTLVKKETAIEFLEKKYDCVLKGRFIIGTIGRLSREKNCEFLITTFPAILELEPNAVCVIIGDGREKLYLQNLILKLNLENKVCLTGEIEGAAQYLEIFDIFLLPSLYEGLSIALIETIFSGTPAIASDVGGSSEIVGNEFTYPLNDENRFLELFKKVHSAVLQQDFERKQSIFTASTMVDSLEKIYK